LDEAHGIHGRDEVFTQNSGLKGKKKDSWRETDTEKKRM
jgi:hypothetical protein